MAFSYESWLTRQDRLPFMQVRNFPTATCKDTASCAAEAAACNVRTPANATSPPRPPRSLSLYGLVLPPLERLCVSNSGRDDAPNHFLREVSVLVHNLPGPVYLRGNDQSSIGLNLSLGTR